MKRWKRALALTPALLAIGACQHIGDYTRKLAGLDENPVRTEYDDGEPAERTLPHAGYDARLRLVAAVQALVALSADASDSARNEKARDVFDRAEEYYHVGRLAMRSQCESYMQTLASVDGQTTFGRDLANNFFDTATVAATISQSPSLWATGLSTAQNAFNSVSGSTERFLLLTESVGALRERVINRMEAAQGTPIQFETYHGPEAPPITSAIALDVARRSIEAVQRYGAPCTEAGIRLIVTEALSNNDIARDAQRARYQSYLQLLQDAINEGVDKDGRRELGDAEIRLTYLWAISAGAEISTDAGKIRNQIETVNLPFLANLSAEQKSRVSFYVQQAINERPDLRNNFDVTRNEVLAAYRQRTEPSATPEPEAPAQPTPAEPSPQTPNEPQPEPAPQQ